ncbi:MAG: hypothetical protein H5T64_08220 [Chloroflexi bacterium]|nr:hypothetical protein [Chloroflexota bacterium]
MGAVRANPKDMREFAGYLKRFNVMLTEEKRQLRARFVRLGETWQDQKYQNFAQEFEQTMRLLDYFEKASEEVVPFLLKDAEILEAYLERRRR